jgi:hypothetical protein
MDADIRVLVIDRGIDSDWNTYGMVMPFEGHQAKKMHVKEDWKRWFIDEVAGKSFVQMPDDGDDSDLYELDDIQLPDDPEDRGRKRSRHIDNLD